MPESKAHSIEWALKVAGWMSEQELSYLADAASRSMLIAEIGSWKGRSTCALAANTEGLVVAVDTFQGSPEHQWELGQHEPQWLIGEFMRNTYGLPVVSVVATSVAAAWMFQCHRFDMIFIDAGHEPQEVEQDIRSWGPLLKTGGILCGHDYRNEYPGIMEVVKRLVPQFRVVDSIWTTEV